MTSVLIESTTTGADVEAVDVRTVYYWLHPGQVLPEHQEVTADGAGDD